MCSSNVAGDWVINILYDNENIDGSPFTVRVYNPDRVKVFGLQDGGECGGPVKFSGQSKLRFHLCAQTRCYASSPMCDCVKSRLETFSRKQTELVKAAATLQCCALAENRQETRTEKVAKVIRVFSRLEQHL